MRGSLKRHFATAWGASSLTAGLISSRHLELDVTPVDLHGGR